MKTSQSITNIAVALLKAQKVMGGAKKGATNPYFKSKYADLGSVLEACKEPLNENGVVILQPHVTENSDYVETILLHESGEWISSSTRIVCAKVNDPQALGSAISYARRYGLQSLLSMPAEDSDAEGAMDRSSSKTAINVTLTSNAPVALVPNTTVTPADATETKKTTSFRKPPKPVVVADEGFG